MKGLPLQNRIVIGAILYAGAFGVEWLTGGDWKFGAVAALLWTVAIVAARTAARFALGGLRGWRYWGMGVIIAAAALTALAQPLHKEICTRLGCAMRIRFCSTFLLLVATAPWFIRKEQFSSTPLS